MASTTAREAGRNSNNSVKDTLLSLQAVIDVSLSHCSHSHSVTLLLRQAPCPQEVPQAPCSQG